MKLKVDMPNMDQIKQQLAERIAERQKAIDKALRIGATLVHGEAVQSIAKNPGGGRVYVRGGVKHEASLPGNPPAQDTGHLMQSIMAPAQAGNLSHPIYEIVVVAKYAKALEYGTRRVEARPFMRPALAKHKPEIVRRVARAVDNG